MVLAVMDGGELDDREMSVIEDEMDMLRMGGCLFNSRNEGSMTVSSLERGKEKFTHK